MPDCRVYWGSHGCMFERGHDGPHVCDCHMDHPPHTNCNDKFGCVGAPPYYGPDTQFNGEDGEDAPVRKRVVVELEVAFKTDACDDGKWKTADALKVLIARIDPGLEVDVVTVHWTDEDQRPLDTRATSDSCIDPT